MFAVTASNAPTVLPLHGPRNLDVGLYDRCQCLASDSDDDGLIDESCTALVESLAAIMRRDNRSHNRFCRSQNTNRRAGCCCRSDVADRDIKDKPRRRAGAAAERQR